MSQREAIIQLHCAGKTNPEIVKLLKAPKSTVRDAVKRYQELGQQVMNPGVDGIALHTLQPKSNALGSG